ncbi:MAG TPA: hypothetical protein VL572_12015 [Pyrinomonadaceae bacterium]|nr:hypothetical protein [Pyrinomonadaceae bacterium]
MRKDLAVTLADLKTLQQTPAPGAMWHDPEPHKTEENGLDQQPSPPDSLRLNGKLKTVRNSLHL